MVDIIVKVLWSNGWYQCKKIIGFHTCVPDIWQGTLMSKQTPLGE